MGYQMRASIDAVRTRIEADARSMTAPRIQAAADEGAGAGAYPAASFAESFAQAVRSVDEMGQVANRKMAAVDSGQSDDLVGAMLASQQASISFSMLMQVRNKVVGALEDLIKLPL